MSQKSTSERRLLQIFQIFFNFFAATWFYTRTKFMELSGYFNLIEKEVPLKNSSREFLQKFSRNNPHILCLKNSKHCIAKKIKNYQAKGALNLYFWYQQMECLPKRQDILTYFRFRRNWLKKTPYRINPEIPGNRIFPDGNARTNRRRRRSVVSALKSPTIGGVPVPKPL